MSEPQSKELRTANKAATELLPNLRTGLQNIQCANFFRVILLSEAESEEKHCIWDPMPKLTSHFLMGNPICQSRP
jgi:hypothetical protein